MAHQQPNEQHPPKTLPSTRVPCLVIVLLCGAIVLLFLWALRSPDQLLFGPPPKNEYIQHMQPSKPPAPSPTPTPEATPADSHEGTE